ncbi:MAG: tetratricopeptide repeat protein [Chloroherpetonaceae bacterium]|nr:tetratricopeptide repeat protein [Chthonomonadaceae bacterium]MDW8206665.1 tetratricopeptide repeat protein [Chloroherpetonaceae bacterium]
MLHPIWRFNFLGDLSAHSGSHVVSRFATRKAATLLAYLALRPGRAFAREALAELFWPDAVPPAHLISLRQALATLRRHLESPPVPPGAVLDTDRFYVQLRPTAFTTDVAEFQQAIRTAEAATDRSVRIAAWLRADALYRGELLPGLYDSWIVPYREHLATQHYRVLLHLAAVFRETRDLDQAIHYARRAVIAEPWREEAQEQLIRLLIAANRTEEARQQYATYARELQSTLGQDPGDTLRDLMATLPEEHPAPRNMPAPERPYRYLPATVSPSPAHPHLPVHLTRFFGRTEELAQLISLLTPSALWNHANPPRRLVSLTGPAGCGKTRLAIEVAGQLTAEYCNNIWFVSLADVTDPRRITEVIRDALELPRTGSMHALEQISGFLRDHRALLVLDNLEHLAPHGAACVQALLARSEQLVCLVTSQHPLMLPGEQVFPVPPLPVPPEDVLDTHALLAFPGVQLFIDRAQAIRPDFALTPRNAGAVASLCARLDGLPLAIELAATWVGVLTPAQMVERLDQRFVLLRDRRARNPGRHTALQAALEWSYRLLPEELQVLFRRLSVFAGSWSLEAVEPVCAVTGVLAPLEQLRGHSLIGIEDAGQAIRYRMLPTLREFAASQFTGAERQQAQRRHFDHFYALAANAAPHLRGCDAALWLERLDADHDNLRAALSWGQRYVPEAALRMACMLWLFWYTRGYLQEGQQWLEEGAQNASLPLKQRAHAWMAAGIIARDRGQLTQAYALCQSALEVFRAQQAVPETAEVLSYLGLIASDQETLEAADAFLEEGLALYRALDAPHGIARTLNAIGINAYRARNYDRALAACRESLSLFRAINALQGIAFTLNTLGCTLHDTGDLAEAERVHAECLALQREIGSKRGIALSLSNLAVTRASLNPGAEITPMLQESIHLFAEVGDRWGLALSLLRLAMHMQQRGQQETAAVLLGALDALSPEDLPEADLTTPDINQAQREGRARLGSDRFEQAYQTGRSLSLRDTVRFALHVGPDGIDLCSPDPSGS